jgi:hypothetical protein
MEMDVEKPKVMRILGQPSPVQIVIHQKQLRKIEYLKYFGSTITNDARRTREIKSKKAMAKQRSTRRLFSPSNCT